MALTLVDSLDALILMGRRAELAEAVARLRHVLDFDLDTEVGPWMAVLLARRRGAAAAGAGSGPLDDVARSVECGPKLDRGKGLCSQRAPRPRPCLCRPRANPARCTCLR